MAEFEQYYLNKPRTLETENQTGGDFISSGNVVRTDKDLSVKNIHIFSDDGFQSVRGRKIGITTATAPNTGLNLSDFFVVVSNVATSKTVTLPKASLAGIGKVYIIKDISGSASATTITISPQTGETINGDTSTSINTNYGFVGLFTDGNNWFTS